MKTMKKVLSMLMSIIMIFSSVPTGALAASAAAPAALTVIQEEAFAGMSQLSGLLTLPENVSAIGRNAFSGSGIYALDLPAGMQSVADQGETDMAYVYVRGSQTVLEGSGWVKHVFASEGSAAQQWAESQSIPFASIDSLAVHEGFYYHLRQDGSAALLCAADENTVPAQVIIPDAVSEHAVTSIGSDAFVGCGQVATIVVPAAAAVAEGAYAGAPNAAVYVRGEAAKLRIEAVDDAWPWAGTGKVRIVADRPAELLNQRSTNVEMCVHIGSEYELIGKTQSFPITLNDNGEAIVEIAAESYMMVEAIACGYTTACIELVSAQDSSAFVVDSESAMIKLPLADLAQETDPIFSVEGAEDNQTILEFVAGKEHKQKIVANNPYVTEGVYTIQVCTADGSAVGTTEINLAETTEAVISFQIPESLIGQEAEIAYYHQAAEAAEPFCFAADARSVAGEPETVIVTNPLMLESDHGRSGLINTMWKYAVDGAVQLSVTFDMAMAKNAYLRVGSQREMDLDTARFFIGRTANDQTVTFNGSEAVFWLRATPDSAETWGFKVKGITATMADGSQVALLDPNAAVPANLSFRQAAQGLRGSWDAVEGAVTYEVYVQHEGETEYKYVETNSGEPVTTNSIDTIAFFTQEQCGVLNYAVCAVFADGSRSQLSAPFQMIALAPPTMVSALQTGDTSFTLMWESVENAESYQIVSGTPFTGFTVIASGLTDTTYVIELPEDADRNAVYNYYVQARGPFGPGVQGKTVTFNGLKEITPTQIVLSATEIELPSLGATYTLYAEVISDTLTNKRVRYTSLNPSIADVDENGVITAYTGGTTYIAVNAADGTSARCRVVVPAERCVVNIVDASRTVETGKEAEITLSFEGTKPAGSDAWLEFSIVYLDKDGMVIDTDFYDYDYFDLETYNMWLYCYGAASALITVYSNDWFEAGENSSVEIAFTNVGSEALDCMVELTANEFYPGATFQLSLKANNPEIITGELPVTITSADGAINLYAGTISQAQPVLCTDVVIPASWKYYDDTEETEYEIFINIGEHYTHSQWMLLWGFEANDVTVAVGSTVERWADDYCWITAEYPLTFAVADLTIASIDEEGSVTGLKVGETTATVTTKSGASRTFAISVIEPSQDDDFTVASGKPSVYIYAPHAKREISGGQWNVFFYVAAEVPESIHNVDEYLVHLSFLDENHNEVDYSTYGISSDGSDWASLGFSADEFTSDVRYVEATLINSSDYTVSYPDSAIVEVVYPQSDDQTPKFDLPTYGGSRYLPGQTIRIPIECLTPELINGSIAVRGMMGQNWPHVESISTLTLTPDAPRGYLEVELSPYAVTGAWVSLDIYAGLQYIGCFDFSIGSGIGVMVYELDLPAGTSRQFPFAIADGMSITPSDLIFSSEDESIAVVDENGLITAIAPGETYVSITLPSKYGFEYYDSIEVYVLEAAGENTPIASMTTSVTEAVFGDPIPLTFKVDRPFESAGQGNIQFMYNAALLDANMNPLTIYRKYEYISSESALAGYETSMISWPQNDQLEEAAYLRLSLRSQTNDDRRYIAQDDACLIKITDIPEPGYVRYSFAPQNKPPYIPGYSIYGNVQRFEVDSTYAAASWQMMDAEGNVYGNGTFGRGSTASWCNIDTYGLMPMQTYTLYLYINGEKTDATFSFQLAEPEMGLNYSERIALDSLGQIRPYFNGVSGYTTTVTYTSSNENVFTVSADGTITPVGIGAAEIIATTAAGQSVSAPIIIFDPNSTVAAELYLTEMASEGASLQWFSGIPFTFGTTAELYRVPGAISAAYSAEFLDANGYVVAAQYEQSGLYHSMLAQEMESWQYIGDNVWKTAFLGNAVKLRFTLESSPFSSAYTVDPERCTITLDLPAPSEYRNPIVTYTAERNVVPGGVFSAVFTCLNPAALREEREVKLYDGQTGACVASGYLTAAAPQVTLTWQLPEDWENHDEIHLEYPASAHNGTVTTTITTYLSMFTGFTIDQRIAVGNDSIVYPSYSGNPPVITYTSSDESIATVELYNGYCARIIGIAPGVAEITATSGNLSYTAKAVVCDFNNTELPVLYLDQSQHGTEAAWNDNTQIRVMTSTAPERIGDGIYANFKYEYLAANGEVLETGSSRQYNYALFADGSETFSCDLAAGEAYARGAKSIRITLTADDYYYTLAQNDLSVTFTIPGIENAEEPVFVLLADAYSPKNVVYTAKVVCLNPEKMTGDYTVSVDYFFGEDEYIINAASPEIAFQIAPQDNSGIDLNVSLQGANSFNQYMYQYVQMLAIDMHDMVVAVGDGVSADQFTFNQPVPVYSIADESIASIDPDTGLITGVSAGSTTVTVRFGNLTTSASVRVYDPSAVENTLVTLEACESASIWPWTTDENDSYKVIIKANNAIENLAGEMTGSIYIDFYDDDGNRVWNQTYSRYVSARFANSVYEEVTLDLNTLPFAQIAQQGATKARVYISDLWPSYHYSSDSSYAEIPMQDLTQLTNEPLIYVVPRNLTGTLYYGNTYTIAFVAGNPYAEGEYEVSIQVDDYSAEDYMARDVDLPHKVISSGRLVPQENPVTELSFVASPDLTPYSSIYLECFVRPVGSSAEQESVGWFYRSLAEAPAYTPVADLTELQSEHNYTDNLKQYLSYTYEDAVRLEIKLDEKSCTEGECDILCIGNYDEMLNDTFGNILSGDIGGYTVTVEGDTAYFKFTSDYSVSYWGFMVESIVATMADGIQVTLTNPYSNLVPELYLAYPESTGANVQWFGDLAAVLGTTSDLAFIDTSVYMNYQIEILDASGSVITDGYKSYSSTFSLLEQEKEHILPVMSTLWQNAFEQNAAQIRLTLLGSADENYTVDPSRCVLTYTLAPISEHPYPIVTFTTSEAVCVGGEFSATFTCLNPAALTEPREVALYDYRYNTLAASGYLTAEEPEITLTWQIPDDWSTYSQIELHYPSRNSDGTVSTTMRPTVYWFEGFAIDDRVAVGSYKNFYPDYSGSYPPIVYTSLDESIATVELYNGYCAKVTGVAPGVAEITASCAGKTFTTKVVVYDPSNTQLPVLYLDQNQNGSETAWDGQTAIKVCTSTAPELIDRSYSYFNVDFKYEWLDENGGVLATFVKRISKYTAFAYGWADYNLDLSVDEAYAAGARSIRVTLAESEYTYTLAENDLSITLEIPGIENAQEPVFVLLANNYAHKDVQYTAKVVCLNPEMMVGDYNVTVDDNGYNSVTYTMNASSPELSFAITPRSSTIYLHVEIEDANNTFYQHFYEDITLVDIGMHDMVVAVGSTVSADQSFPSGLYPVYSMQDESIATVDPDTGLITGVSAGTTTVYVDFGYDLFNSAMVRVYDPDAAEKIPLTLEACTYAPAWPWKSDSVNLHWLTIKANGDRNKLGAPANVSLQYEFYDDEDNKVGESTSWQTVGANFVGTTSENIRLDLSHVPFAQIAAAGATKARLRISSLSYECQNYYSYDSSAYVDIPMEDLSQMPDEPLLCLLSEELPDTLFYDSSYTVTFAAGNPYALGTYKVSIQAEDPDHYGSYLTFAEAVWDLAEGSQKELTFTVTRDQIPDSSIYLEYCIQPEDGSAEPTLLASKYHSLAAKPVYTQVSSIAELQSEHNYANNTKLRLSYTYENAVSLRITLDENSITESRYDVLAIGDHNEMLTEAFAENLSGSIGGKTVTVSGDTAYFKFTSDGSVATWGFRVKTIVATMADGSQVTISNPYCGVVPEMYLAYAEDSESIGWYGELPAVLGTTSDVEFISDELEIYYELELLDANGDVIDDVYDPYAPYSVSFAALEQEQDCQLEMSTNLWDQAFEQGAAKVRVILLDNYDDSYTIQPDCGAITLEMTPYEEHPFPIVTFELSEVVVPGGELVASFTCHNPACLSEPRQVALYDDQTNQCVATGYLTAENPQVTLTWQLPEDWDEDCYVKLEHPVPYNNGVAIRPLSPAVLQFNGFEIDGRVVKGDYRVFYPDLNGASATVTYTSSDESIATVEPYDSYGSHGVKVNGIAPGVAEITATCVGKSFTAKVVVYDPMNTQDTVLYLDQSWNGKEAVLGAETLIRVASSTAPELMDRPYDGNFFATFKYEWLDENGQSLLAASYTCAPNTQFADGWVDCPVKLYADEALAVGAASIRVTLIGCDYRSVLAESDLSITLDVPGVEDVQEPVFALVADNYAQKNTMYTAKVVCLNPETLDGDYTVYVNYDASYIVNEASPEVEFWVSPTSESGISLHAYIHGPDAKLYQHLQQSVTLIDIGMRNMVVAVGDTISADQFGYSYLFPVFSIADENIASIDPITGLITGKSAGTTTVHVKFSYNLSNSILIRVYDPDTAAITPLSLQPSMYFPEWAWTDDPTSPHMITITANGDRSKLGGVADVGLRIAFFDDEGNQVWDTTYSNIVQASFVGTASDNVKLSLSDVPFPQIAAAGATKARVSIDSLYFGSSEYYSCDPESYAEISMKDLSQMTDEMLLFVDQSDLPNRLFYGSTYSVSFVAGNPYAAGKYKVSLQARDDSYYGYYDVITENIWEPSKDSVIELDFNTTMDLAPDGYLTLACFIQPEDGSGSPVKICETEYRVIDAADVPVYTQVYTLAELQSEHEYDDDIDLRLSYTVENAVKLEIQLHEDSYTEDNWDYLYFADYDKMLLDDFVYKVSGPLGRGIFIITGDTAYIRFTSDGSNTCWGFAVSSIKATMSDGTTVVITE